MKLIMKWKYRKKDRFTRKKTMNLDQYNNKIMEYQKIVNLLDNTPNQLSKFGTKRWIEIIDQSREVHNTNSDITFKNTMPKYGCCDYSDVYLLVKERITITGAGDDAAA